MKTLDRCQTCSRCGNSFELDSFVHRLLQEENVEIESIICYSCLNLVEFAPYLAEDDDDVVYH